MTWQHNEIAGGGEKRQLVDGGRVLATVVRLPGTITRVYWPDGTMSDRFTWDEAPAAVEAELEAKRAELEEV